MWTLWRTDSLGVSHLLHRAFFTKSAEKPRHSCRGWIGVGRAGLNAQAPNKTHAVPEPSMGEGTAEVEAPAFMPGRMSPGCAAHEANRDPQTLCCNAQPAF